MTGSRFSVLCGLVCNPSLDWQVKMASLTNLQIREIGLYVYGLPLPVRREVYRALEKSSVVKIPYVQLAGDAEDSEIEYIVQRYHTEIFSLPPVAAAYAIANRRVEALQTILIENPEASVKEPLFTEEALASPGVKGICLDTACLEYDRRHRTKMYQSHLYALDHHPVLCSVISPMAETWLSRWNGNNRHLTSLKDLRYLHNLPPKYLETRLVLKMDNFFDEQLEVTQYLQSIFAETV